MYTGPHAPAIQALNRKSKTLFCTPFAFQFKCALCIYLQVAVYSAMRRLCILKMTRHDRHYNELMIVRSNMYATSLTANSAHAQPPEYVVAPTFENLVFSGAARKHSISWDVSYFHLFINYRSSKLDAIPVLFLLPIHSVTNSFCASSHIVSLCE